MPIINGTAADDRLMGGAGDDELYGLDGNDTLVGGGGHNRLVGGNGYNTVDYSGATLGVTVSLAVTNDQDTGYSVDQIIGVQQIIGSTYADTLTGSLFDDTLVAGSFIFTGIEFYSSLPGLQLRQSR